MRLTQSAFYSFLFTLYGGCFYFAIGTFLTIAQHGSIPEFLGSFVVSMLACFVLLWFVFHEIMGAFEELNKRGRRDEEEHKKEPENK